MSTHSVMQQQPDFDECKIMSPKELCHKNSKKINTIGWTNRGLNQQTNKNLKRKLIVLLFSHWKEFSHVPHLMSWITFTNKSSFTKVFYQFNIGSTRTLCQVFMLCKPLQTRTEEHNMTKFQMTPINFWKLPIGFHFVFQILMIKTHRKSVVVEALTSILIER